MLYQLHWKLKDGTTDMRAQSPIYNQAEMNEWKKETAKDWPLPEGAEWLICNEKSKHFVMAVSPTPGNGSTSVEAVK